MPFFRSYRIGPVLAYKLGEFGTTSMGREKLEQLLRMLTPGSTILFCFGEIDCRAHVLLQSEKQHRPPEDIIADVVERYIDVILKVKCEGYQPLIWNVIPSAPTTINDRITVPPQYLFYGSSGERNQVTREFNQQMEKLADCAGVSFLNIFDRLMKENGSVNRAYYSDEIHLSQKAMPMAVKALNDVFTDYRFSDDGLNDDAVVFFTEAPASV